jgi:soluble lytic murein transglycosylase-like protein
MNVRAFVLIVCLVKTVAGQQPADPAVKIREAMQASLDQQRASVRRQTETAQAVPPGTFFTIPWPDSAGSAQAAAADFDCEPISEPQLASLIEAAAKREDMQPSLIRAVVQRESAARPCAVSPKGAQGLMQLMPATAGQFSVSDPFDPKQNIDAGAKFLKQLLTKYGGDLSLALGAYNAGPGRVDKEGGVPQIAETQSYVADILKSIKQ